MKKFIFIIAILFFTASAQAQTIVATLNSTNFIVKDAGEWIKEGDIVEIVRYRKGNDVTTYTNWTVNESPVLPKGNNYAQVTVLAPAENAVLGNIILNYEYARVKVKRIAR